LKKAVPRGQVDPIKYRLVSARGCPTPDKDMISRYYGLNPFAIGMLLLLTPGYNNLPSESAKLYSVLASLAMPGFYGVKDGSMLVAVDSSRGEGVTIFNENTKRYEYLTIPDSYERIAKAAKTSADACVASYWALSLVPGFQFNPSILSGLLYFTTAVLSRAEMVGLRDVDVWQNMLANHGFIIENSYKRNDGKDSIIEQALDDTPIFGGRTSTQEARAGISAASVSTVTSSYNDYDQALALLSNLDSSGKKVGTYHTVTIEAITQGNSPICFLVEVDGKKKMVSAITVKEPPTAVKGVINTFLPKKLKQFQYSENFAAWKDVGAVDAWGNFTLKGLKLAEGQNVVAFQAESWTGNKSNQQLKIILNTIPCFPGNYYPADGAYTNNPRQKAGVEFRKSKYAGTGQGFHVLTCEMDGAAVTPVVTTGEADYIEWIKVEIVPPEPLADGEHRIAIKVQSDVGVSQALWSYTVDTVAPGITIEPIKPVSFRK